MQAEIKNRNGWVIESLLVFGCIAELEMIIVSMNWSQITQANHFALFRPGELLAQLSSIFFLFGMVGFTVHIILEARTRRKLCLRNTLAAIFCVGLLMVICLYNGR